MKFKIGDKVKHKVFGVGKIVHINEYESEIPYAVEFKTFNENLHNLGIGGAPKVKNYHGWWCKECDLELVEEAPHNLIPQIAKMLGIEIGEEFMLDQEENQYTYRFVENGVEYYKDDEWRVDKLAFHSIVSGILKVKKLPPKPKLTEDEKVILRNIPEKYKYIARESCGELYVYENKPVKMRYEWNRGVAGSSYNNLNSFQHLFQFIKWEDNEPYNIEELLKE
jgi:hypothetical protein